MGIGFTLALTLMGIVRELLGKASFFGIELWDANVFSIKFFSNSAGAFLTYGLFIAVFTVSYNAVERKVRRNQSKKELASKASAQDATAETAKEAE